MKPLVLRPQLVSDSGSADFIVTSDRMTVIRLIRNIGCDHGVVHSCVRLHIAGTRIDPSRFVTILRGGLRMRGPRPVFSAGPQSTERCGGMWVCVRRFIICVMRKCLCKSHLFFLSQIQT
jgi:hypothetical protein